MEKPAKTGEDFYFDLDKAKRHSCTCSSFLLFMGFLLVSLSFIVYFLVKQIKSRANVLDVTVSRSALELAENKLQSFLRGKEASAQSVTLTLTDQELTSLLVKSELLSADSRWSLKNPSAVITPRAIDISAFLTKPIQSRINAQVKPVVGNGKLELKVLDVSAGSLKIPSFLRGGAESLLSRLVVSRLNSEQIIYDNAVLGNHLLTLSGRKK